jgi:hypothetical protein
MWAEEVFPQPSFSFCQQVPYSTLSEDIANDQLSLKEYIDPFTEEKSKA